MEVWLHESKLYDVVSTYNVRDDSWQCELVGTTEPAFVAVVIPDATPDGDQFIPRSSDEVFLSVADGTVPWPLLVRLVELAEDSGHIVDDAGWRSAAAAEGPLSTLTVWTHDGRTYEINSFHFGARDSWCYELCAPSGDPARNDFLEVLIPDAQPGGGPFVALPSDLVTVGVHGEWDVPWPIFRRFIEAIRASGNIIDTAA